VSLLNKKKNNIKAHKKKRKKYAKLHSTGKEAEERST
jgi:hypothetical protein